MSNLPETMNPDVAHKLLKVGEAFRIPGPFFSYEEIKMGNVNHTYKVNYIRDDGSGMAKIKSYLVQRVNTYAFQRPLELMSNIDKVTEYIHANFPTVKCLHFHHTQERHNYLMDADGFWRLSNYVPSVTFNSCDDLEIVRSAGQAFGDFQMMLSKFDASSLYYTIPDFHNTRKRYEKLKADMAEDPCGRVAEVREELDWLLSVEDEACKLTDLYEAGELPLRVTHNDTKINNVLFDEESLKPLVVIDLDTVMPGLVGHDFGDAIRFAANFVEEDSPEAEKAGLNISQMESFMVGMFSILDRNDPDFESLLNELELTDRIKNGLMDQQSLMGRILKVVQYYEQGDWKQVDAMVGLYGWDLGELYRFAVEYADEALEIDDGAASA